MPKLNRSKLLQFLSKPRYTHEVAEYFDIPGKIASYHLKEAVKSGQILISEKPFPKRFSKLRGELKRSSGFLYVSRSSPLLAKDLMRQALRRDETFLSTGFAQFFHVKFVSKVGNHDEEVFPRQEIFAFSDLEKRNVQIEPKRSKPKINSVSTFLNLLAAKGRLVKQNVRHQLVKHEAPFSQGYKPLSQAERIHLFQAVAKHPLTYLELHGRFGVSKQVIEGFVRRGLFEEMWGDRNISVKFGLTNKGKAYMKELEAAAKCESKIGKKAIIRLKSMPPI